MSRGLNKQFRINLATARTGQGERIAVSGRFIRVTKASSGSALCEISLEGEFNTNYFDMIDQACMTERQGFEGIFVKNEAQPGEWLILTVTDGPEDFDYQKPTNNNINEILTPVEVYSGTAFPVDAIMPGTLGDIVDIAIAAAAAHAQVLPVLATRKSCLIKNIGTNPARIGNAPTNTRGHHLAANETFAADGTFEVRAFSQLGTTLSIIWTEA